MNKILTAIALSIALPGIVHAQSTPEAAPKTECCNKMQEKCCCCEKMRGKPAAGQHSPASDDPHAGHDMKPASSPEPAGGHSHH